METMITGYQWKTDMSYLSPYLFPMNQDKTTIHLPPNTTLKKPPTVDAGFEAAWNGIEWIVRPVTSTSAPISAPISTPDPSTLNLPPHG